jgi:enterochelin esterase-like enzyme
MKKTSTSVPLHNIQSFLDGTRGQITIGEIPPIRRAVLAAQGKTPRVALLGRDGETVTELLERLDAALGKAMADNSVVDEVLPEIKRRRAR